jgi:tRNA 2-selenouridine synthase
VVLGGLTGAGKTRFLRTLAEAGEQVLDLEALANHRGSVLGGEPGGQPAQKLFESRLFQALTQFDLGKPVLIEAESARIGLRQIPGCLWEAMQRGRYLELDVPLPLRAALLMEDYPHFQDDPESLLARLRPLARHRGDRTIARWETMLADGHWEDLVCSLLHDHYDQGYLKALRKHYGTPATILPVESISPEAHKRIAESIRTRMQAPKG